MSQPCKEMQTAILQELVFQAFNVKDSCSEEFFFTYFAEGSPSKFNCWPNDFLRLLFSCFPLNGFSTYPSWKKSPFNAQSVRTVCHVTPILSPSAPNAISTIHCSVFPAFKQFTSGRTCLYLRQGGCNL